MAWKLKHKNGKTIIHCSGYSQQDISLCGQDLMGDSWGDKDGWDAATRTIEQINCEDCKSIIEFCKLLPDKIISKKTVSPHDWSRK